ncbi:putative membrane protein YeiB [Bradyrhizobium japonicum]
MQGQARLAAERTEQGATPFGRSHTLDVLRGLAIVGVMAIHVSQSFPSKIHAVDFAFMCGWTGGQRVLLRQRHDDVPDVDAAHRN